MFPRRVLLFIIGISLLGCASWDRAAGIAVVQTGHSRNVGAVAFSPDGSVALSGSDDGTLKLWEVSTGREIRTFKGHSTSITCASFSPNGRILLSGHNDGTLAYFEASTGRKISSFKGHQGWIHSVAFSPDGKLAFSGGEDRAVRIWNVGNGLEIKTLRRTGRNPYFFKTTISFSPDGRFALWGEGGEIELWDISKGRKIRTTAKVSPLAKFGGSANCFSFSHDSRFVLVGGYGLDLFEVSTGKIVRTFPERSKVATQIRIQSLSLSPDDRFVLAGSEDGTLILWEISTGRKIRVFERYPKRIHSVATSPDGRFALTGNKDGTLVLWAISTGRRIRTFKGNTVRILSVAYSPDGRYALFGGEDTTLKLWNVSSGKNTKTFVGHTDSVVSIAFSPDGRFALSGGNDSLLKLWNVTTGREIRTYRGHTDAVTSVTFSTNGRYALSGAKDSSVILWEISTGREIHTFEGHQHWVTSVAYSPDGRYVLSGSKDDTIRLWDVSNGQNIRTFSEHSGDVNSCTFSYDGRYILSGGWRALHLWDVASGRRVRTFKGHSGNATSVAFSPDGRYVLSGGDDNSLRLWSLRNGSELHSYSGHLDNITSVAFSPDGRFILSGSLDTTARIWGIEAGEEVAKLLSSSDGEWIIVTPDGYYSTSAEGASLIHWIYPGGFETFTFEQFESLFKRPDIIRSRLASGSKYNIQAPAMTQPPHIETADHLSIKETSARSYSLTLTASALEEVRTVRVFVNGKPTLEVPVNAKEKELSMNVPLFSGANRITAVAYDEKGFSSNPKYVDVTCKNAGLGKPNLYIFAIGISEYPKLSARWQLEFAHTDAKALIKALKGQEGKLFGEVRYSLLSNKKATVQGINDVLDALSGMDENDLAVIFMAGHGVKAQDGTFYFLTSDGSFEEPQRGGLSWDAVGEHLSRVKGRVILLLDACHSGSIVTETVVPNDELAQEFFTGERGGIMVFSASKGRQYSLESPDIGGGFGIFTYALTQSLGPAAKYVDSNSNGFVEFMELVDSVSTYVDKETKGEQTPWLSRKELFGDLPIAAVN
jgi:WD40 repeat protein